MITPGRVGAAVCLSFVFASTSAAQSIGSFIKERAKERAKQKIAECIATDLECIRRAKADGAEVKITKEPAAQPGTDAPAASAPASNERPGEGAWVNYDFKPGDQPLFVEDFTRDEVGDFPRRLELTQGNMEVAEWKGGRYLRITSWPGKFAINLPQQLPDRFTLEFVATPTLNQNYLIVRFAEQAPHDVRFLMGAASIGQAGVYGGTHEANGRTSKPIEGPFTFRIMADGKYVKVYVDDTRVANIPNADLGRSKTIAFEVPANETQPVLISNISLMAGGKKLYDALSETGRVATQGIYFDIGSDRLRPESTPTLKEIGAMLKEHPELKLTIEGHTDNVGDPEANKTLAEKRATAVKTFLVNTYTVDAARLETRGFGDQKPVAQNTTPEGRQQNRRVELVKN
jgi:OmpA-OmpF porin, OOP family